MRPAAKLSITLPADMARMVRDKVKAVPMHRTARLSARPCGWQEREAVRAQRLDEVEPRSPRPLMTRDLR